jgi:Zn-dependent peptidase ImmA (M78 family)
MAKFNYEEISQLALDFRNRCFLNAYEAIDCEKLLLQLNVLTVFRPLSTSFSGMCEKKKDKRFMLINSNQVLSRQHFTIAHELYHLYVQKEFKIHICNPDNANIKDIEEKKADTFASNLLMPELGIKRLIPVSELEEGIKLSTLFKLEKYFSVSHTALLYRLRDLKLLTKEEVEKHRNVQVIRLAQLYGFDTKLYEIAGNERVIIGDYAILAKEKFDQNKISEGHYLELLSEIGIQLPAL